MFTAGVITVSDSVFNEKREDISGKLLTKLLEEKGFEVIFYKVVPDEFLEIKNILSLCIDNDINLILTTGGTGFSKRDITPEATETLLIKKTPGIDEAIRLNSSKYTDRFMLSRAISGINKNSLIINMPGSPKACKECGDYILPKIQHGLNILLDKTHNCGD